MCKFAQSWLPIEKYIKVEAEQIVAHQNVHVQRVYFTQQIGEKSAFGAAKLNFEFLLIILDESLQIVWKNGV